MRDIYSLIINFFFGTVAWIFLIRLTLQLVRAPFNNSFVQSVYRYLAPILRPFERVIPKYNNFSIPCLVVILLIGQLWSAALNLKVGAIVSLFGVFLVLESLYWLLTIVLIAFAISSFFPPNPYNEMMQVIQSIARPIVNPIRKVVPMFGPLDLSVAIALLTITILFKLCQVGFSEVLPLLASPAVITGGITI